VDESWTIEDSLSSVCADLLSFEKFEPFVSRLFASPSGSWQTVAGLCSELSELPEHGAELFAGNAAALVVTHLTWPEGESSEYALVLFFHQVEFWSTVAMYNRQRLQSRNRRHSG
jgi:hypothetical protein